MKAISATETEITFTADEELMGDLERLKDLMGESKICELIRKMAKLSLKKYEPKESVGAPRVEVNESSRHVPVAIQRFVRARDQGRCTYRDPKSARVCGSSFATEIDHITPWAHGGSNQAENLRLLCRAHNRYYARQVFGLRKVP
jgi:hypothetical protein